MKIFLRCPRDQLLPLCPVPPGVFPDRGRTRDVVKREEDAALKAAGAPDHPTIEMVLNYRNGADRRLFKLMSLQLPLEGSE